jgi:hypothetical protein
MEVAKVLFCEPEVPQNQSRMGPILSDTCQDLRGIIANILHIAFANDTNGHPHHLRLSVTHQFCIHEQHQRVYPSVSAPDVLVQSRTANSAPKHTLRSHKATFGTAHLNIIGQAPGLLVTERRLRRCRWRQRTSWNLIFSTCPLITSKVHLKADVRSREDG